MLICIFWLRMIMSKNLFDGLYNCNFILFIIYLYFGLYFGRIVGLKFKKYKRIECRDGNGEGIMGGYQYMYPYSFDGGHPRHRTLLLVGLNGYKSGISR